MTLTHDDYNGTEKWRYLRLSKVAQIMCIINPELQDSISNLNDHEGCLTVTWITTKVASSENKSIMQGIWELLNEYQVEHEFF